MAFDVIPVPERLRFIPAGGSRAGPTRHMLAFMITMLLGGFWHGASWTFVVWGGLHGGILVVNHLWTRAGGKLARLPAWLATTAFIFMTWVFFGQRRSPPL
jgi:alginate O-acetyltransferase complex protein AlgI